MTEHTLPAQLVELEKLWRDIKIPAVEFLAEPASKADLDGITLVTGCSPPSEAYSWWRWHNGLARIPDADASAYEIGPGYRLLSLTEAVDEYRSRRRVAADLAADRKNGATPDTWWHPSWFPLVRQASGEATLACDCSSPATDIAPVLAVEWTRPDGWQKPVTLSIAELVSHWLDAINTGTWSYDHHRRRWARHSGGSLHAPPEIL
jgi:cell wall assembly regulator SMI1